MRQERVMVVAWSNVKVPEDHTKSAISARSATNDATAPGRSTAPDGTGGIPIVTLLPSVVALVAKGLPVRSAPTLHVQPS